MRDVERCLAHASATSTAALRVQGGDEIGRSNLVNALPEDGSEAALHDAASEPGRAVPRRVWRGTLLLVLGRLWGSACTIVALKLLAGALAPADFGRYTFYLAVFVVLDTLVDFGTGQVAVQLSSDDERAIPNVLAATRRIRFVAGLLGVVLVGGGAFLAGEPGAAWILLASLYPVTHVLELSTTVFRTRIAWEIPVTLRVIAASLSLCFVLVLLSREIRDPAHYLVAVAAGSAIGNGLLHLVSRKHLPKERATAVPIRAVLRLALPLGVATLCQQAYFYVDNLFVRAYLGPEPLGRYNIGVRVMSITIMVAIYAAQAALPWLAREHARGALGPAVARLGQPLFALAGLAAGSLWPWTEEILALFGPEFAVAGASTRWLLCATTVVYAGACLMTALVAAGRTRSIFAIALVALCVNLAANAVLVPRYGIEGAGVATFATESVVALGAAVALARIGAAPSTGKRAWWWLAGPVLFVGAAALSSRIVP